MKGKVRKKRENIVWKQRIYFVEHLNLFESRFSHQHVNILSSFLIRKKIMWNYLKA